MHDNLVIASSQLFAILFAIGVDMIASAHIKSLHQLKQHERNSTMIKIANKDGYRYGETAYMIGNEFGVICISYAKNEQDALDNAVDADMLDCMRMSPDDHAEYEAQGWDDSYCLLGNADAPFWTEYLWIKEATTRKE